MDLDAEMRKLQEEARRALERREAADAEAAELPPLPVPEAIRERDGEPGAVAEVGSALAAARAVGELAKGLDSETLGAAREVARLAEEARGPGTPLLTKLAWGAGGLIAFAVLWELFLGPLVWAMAGLAFVVLLCIGLLKLFGFGRRTDAAEEEVGGDGAS